MKKYKTGRSYKFDKLSYYAIRLIYTSSHRVPTEVMILGDFLSVSPQTHVLKTRVDLLSSSKFTILSTFKKKIQGGRRKVITSTFISRCSFSKNYKSLGSHKLFQKRNFQFSLATRGKQGVSREMWAWLAFCKQ